MMLWCRSPRRVNHEAAAIAVGWEPLETLSEGSAEDTRIFLCGSGNLEEGDICPGSSAGTRKDNTPIVVKVIPSGSLDENAEEKLRSEVQIFSSFATNHPNILDFLGHVRAVPGYHILESEALFGGPLNRHLRASVKLPLQQALYYCAEMASAIEFLQIHSIVHRDIKASNIVLDHNGHAVLIGFGCSKNIAIEDEMTSQIRTYNRYDNRTKTFCGSPHIMAPEMVKQSGHGLMVDWWALGVLLWELLSGEPPFGYCNKDEDMKLILKGLGEGEPSIDFFRKHQPSMKDDNVATLLVDLIQKLLVYDPRKRLGGVPGEVLAHNVWNQVQTVDPTSCSGTQAIKQQQATIDGGDGNVVITPGLFLKSMISPPEFNKELGSMEYAPLKKAGESGEADDNNSTS